MNRAPWTRRLKRYQREAQERSSAEAQAHLDKLRNMTQAELDELIAAYDATRTADEKAI